MSPCMVRGCDREPHRFILGARLDDIRFDLKACWVHASMLDDLWRIKALLLGGALRVEGPLQTTSV